MMSDKFYELMQQELQRLHEIAKRPVEKPGKGRATRDDPAWARDRISKIHCSLFCYAPYVKDDIQQEK